MFGEEDELQPSGKVFQKLLLGPFFFKFILIRADRHISSTDNPARRPSLIDVDICRECA